MFIYEFMSGVAGYIAGGESDAFYDPHMHRKLAKPTTYAETLIHMIKGSLGAGVLAMPQAMARAGLIMGIPGLIIIGFFATFCLHQLIKAEYEVCRRLRIGYLSYGLCAEHAALWGPPCIKWISPYMPFIVDFSLLYFQLGLCVVYPVFISENTRQVLEFCGIIYSVRTVMLILLPFLVVVNLIKDLKMLTPVSTISNTVTIFGLLLVGFYMIETDVIITSQDLEFKPVMGIPFFVGITLFALEAVGVVLALEYNMDRPKEFGGYFGLLNLGMVLIIALYMAVGVCGYIKYGENVRPAITLNLPSTDKKAQASKALLALAVFLSFPLQNFVAYQILWDKWRIKYPNHKHPRLEDYTLRIMCTVLPWSVGYLFPFLENLISIIGGIAISVLAFIIPPFMDIGLVWSQQNWPKPPIPPQMEAMDVVVTKSNLDEEVNAVAAYTAAAKAVADSAKRPPSSSARTQSAPEKPLPLSSKLRILGDILLMLAGVLALISIVGTCL